MCLACDAVDSGRGARALVRFWHTHANMRWLRRALLPAAHVAPTVSLHTPNVESSVSKKDTKEPLSWPVLFIFYRAAAPQSPCALRGCCPLAMRWLCRALLPAAHVAPTVSLLHTPIVDSSVSKKRHQRATLLASAVFFYRAAAPQLPCALLGCCPSRQRLTGAPTIILLLSRVTTTAVCLPLPPGTTMRKYITLSKTGYAAGALGGPRRRAYKHLHYAPHNF
jgi:hypothetical protein